MVTDAPRSAARIASPPQPVPISATREPSRTRARSRMPSIFRRCASASVSPGSNQAEEYVMVSSRNSSKSSLDRS